MPVVLDVDVVYVLHVKRGYEDRAASIQRQLDQRAIPFEFVLDWDVEDLTPAIQERFFAHGQSMKPTVQSCCMKHYQALKQIVDSGAARALVLEDDVLLDRDFTARFNQCIAAASDLEEEAIVCIGNGCNLYTRRQSVEPGKLLYRQHGLRAADSYIVSQRVARTVTRHIEQHGFHFPFDAYLNDIVKPLGITVYWLEPTIAEQGSQNGTFQSSLNKPKPLWFKKLDWHWEKLRRRFLWQKRHQG